MTTEYRKFGGIPSEGVVGGLVQFRRVKYENCYGTWRGGVVNKHNIRVRINTLAHYLRR